MHPFELSSFVKRVLNGAYDRNKLSVATAIYCIHMQKSFYKPPLATFLTFEIFRFNVIPMCK